MEQTHSTRFLVLGVLVPGFLAIGAVGALALLWGVGSQLSAPAIQSIGEPPASLGARSVAFSSSSGSSVHAWLVPGVSRRGAIVLAHSVRSNRLEMLGRAAFLRDAGYALLLFDAQAHGESPGQRITFGYLESLDARAAVSFARSAWPLERVGYLGVSQGGAAALLGVEPLAVDALIVEAVYPTLREAIVNRVEIRLGALASFVAPLLLLQVGPRLGVDLDEIAPIDGIRRIRTPLLLIAGAADRHTTQHDSDRLFDAAPAPKEIWVLPDAAHQNFHQKSPVEYERRVLEFFGQHLGTDPSSP